MSIQCRRLSPSSRRIRWRCSQLLCHARVVTDPQELARLKAEAKRRKAARADAGPVRRHDLH